MRFRCEGCEYNKHDFCRKLKVDIPNGYAMLYLGGAEGDYGKDKIKYPSKCGIERINGMKNVRNNFKNQRTILPG